MISHEKIIDCVDALSEILMRHCNKVIENGELAALAGWVNSLCLKDINSFMERYLIKGNEIRFRLAWIDKSPIAKYTLGGEEISGEIADVAIIRLHLHKGTVTKNSRMFFLQAKATKLPPPFIASESDVGQTQKEWAFMTNWPAFRLRSWGASADNDTEYDVMQNISQADREKTIHAMNWFGVAPFNPSEKGYWGKPDYDACPWWTAPPVQNRPCKTALSKLLLKIALRKEKIGDPDTDGYAGRDFSFTDLASAVPNLKPPLSRSWDDLANEIIRIAQENDPAKEQLAGDGRLISFLTSSGADNFGAPDTDSDEIGDSGKKWPVIFILHIE